MWILRRFDFMPYEPVKYYGPFGTGEEAHEYALKLSKENVEGCYSPLKLITPERV